MHPLSATRGTWAASAALALLIGAMPVSAAETFSSAYTTTQAKDCRKVHSVKAGGGEAKAVSQADVAPIAC